MPKIATKMRAQRGSKCPECHYPIVVGTNIKVYDNKWLHTKCWSDVKDKTDIYEEVPQEDLWEDGELSTTEVQHKILHRTFQQGDWILVRRIEHGKD